MKTDNRPVGIFDSGLGGLTVVAAIRKKLKNENIIYLGDTARVPYGDKSSENIAKFAIDDARFLVNKGVKMIIIACNTVSAVAIEAVRENFRGAPVVGVLDAGVQACLSEKPKSVVIIGTRATIASDTYRKNIHAQNPSIKVHSIATPLFVPIIEEGLQGSPIAVMAIETYLRGVKSNPPDILLLACTHYPFLKESLAQYLPSSVKIIDSAESCANFAAQELRRLGLEGKSDNAFEKYFATDMPSNFYLQATRFLGKNIEHFEKISLGV
jgi:glutamate racemase